MSNNKEVTHFAEGTIVWLAGPINTITVKLLGRKEETPSYRSVSADGQCKEKDEYTTVRLELSRKATIISVCQRADVVCDTACAAKEISPAYTLRIWATPKAKTEEKEISDEIRAKGATSKEPLSPASTRASDVRLSEYETNPIWLQPLGLSGDGANRVCIYEI